MPPLTRPTVTAALDGEVVVFLIGMRINSVLRVDQWWPILLAMSRMLREVSARPDLGLLGYESWIGRTTLMVQYWRSFEQLEHYAKAKDQAHLPAWAEFNRRTRATGHVGIWHETYRVRPGDVESIYANMPPFGLARATRTVPVAGALSTAIGRMRGG